VRRSARIEEHFDRNAKAVNQLQGQIVVISPRAGAKIHRQDLSKYFGMKTENGSSRSVGGKPQNTFPVEISIKAYDRQGHMGIFLPF
jgi:hypothetical protein